jgi:hypothetical protein
MLSVGTYYGKLLVKLSGANSFLWLSASQDYAADYSCQESQQDSVKATLIYNSPSGVF